MVNQKKKEFTRTERMEFFHQDGILDIVAGAVMLNFGFDILNQASLSSLFTYIPIVLMSAMKNQITISRIGYDAFGGNDRKVRNWNLANAVGLVLTLILLSIFIINDPLNLRDSLQLSFGRHLPSLLTGIILALACLAAGWLIPLKRFLLYAATVFALGAAGFFFFPAQVVSFLFAGVLLGSGAKLMIRFSRAYPMKEDPKIKNNRKK